MRRNTEAYYKGGTCLVYANSHQNITVFRADLNELTESVARMQLCI